MALTKEELDELATYENEEKARLAAEADEAKRQHLEALRTSRRLTPKLGKPGHDFLVLETKVGNIVIRRPVDVEIDNMTEDADRGAVESFASSITVEPSATELQALMAQHHGLAGAILNHSLRLIKITREEVTKK